MALKTFEFTWDKKLTIQLANVYKDHPSLWNPQHDEYNNRELRHRTMIKIAQDMGIERREIERKFKNILSHFMREIKREATVPGYRSKWFAYDALSYLKERSSNEPIATRKRKVETDNSNIECEDDKDATLDSEQKGSFVSGAFYPKTLNKFTSSDDPLIGGPILRPEDHATTSFVDVKDDATVFGEHIANKIRSMEQRTRSIVEFEINSIIFKAEMGFYTDKKFDFSSMTQS